MSSDTVYSNSILENIYEKVTNGFIWLSDLLADSFYDICQNYSIQAIWAYSKFCVLCENCMNDLYDENWVVRSIMDGVSDMKKWFQTN